MKTIYKVLTTVLLLGMAKVIKAQDVIVKTDNTTILSRVLEVSSTEVKYKKWSNLEGPTYSLLLTQITRINYQNGDVEDYSNANTPQRTNQQPTTYPQQSYGSGQLYMDVSGGRMRLNGRPLRDEEVRRLVGDIDFLEYKQGNNLLGVGAVFSTLGGVSLTLGGIGFGIDDTKEYTRVCGILIVSGLAGLAIGLPFILPGAKKMEGVAKRFNQNHGVHSLNLSPTLMPLEIPQEDNSYALGLSLNMKF